VFSENNLGCLSYCNIQEVGTTIHMVKAVEEVMLYRKVYKVICEKIMIFLLAKEIEIIYY